MRILVFFIGSITLLVMILPWNSTEVGASPYVAALETMGIPYAADVMNLVVLTAVLSCLNSGLYTASRMLFVLAARNEAPRRLLDVSRRGVPVRAILTSTAVGYVCVIAAYLWPKTIFTFLLNSSGAIALFVYLLIAVSELRLRRQIEATAPETLRVKMWFYPWLTYATILGIGVVIVSMFALEAVRSQAALSSLAWAVTVLAYLVFRGRMAGARAAVAVIGDPTAPSQIELAEVETALTDAPEGERESAQPVRELVAAPEPTR